MKLTKQKLKQLKNNNKIRVVTIDDPEDKRLESDLAFYPPIPQLKKITWGGFSGKLFVGWEYVLLRDEYNKSYPRHYIITIYNLI